MTKRLVPNCQICECGNHAWATLTKWAITMVSPEDLSLLGDFVWTLHEADGKVYAYRKAKGNPRHQSVFLHREITAAPPDSLVDHRDANGLNNRRSNVRVTDGTGNCANRRKGAGSSRFKGVYWHKRDAVWMARIKINRKTRYLGSFDRNHEREAAAAYDRAAIEVFGAMALTNGIA
jgi:hypothetical protein